MALSRVGGSSVASTSITIPAHSSGDIALIWAYRDGTTAAPTVPAAGGTVPTWNTIDTGGANVNSAVLCWALLTGSSTSGTWTNATGMSVEVWSGQHATPIGGHAVSGSAASGGGSLVVPAITLSDTSGNAVQFTFVGWRTVTGWTSPPAGYTQRSSVSTETEVVTKDSSTSDGSYNLSGTASGSGGYRCQQVELLPAAGGSTFNDSGSGTITLSGSGSGSQTHSATGSGTITFSGTGTGSQTHSGSGSGTITLSGSGTRSTTFAGAGSGTITFGGSGSGSQTHSASGSGTITFGGEGVEDYQPPGAPTDVPGTAEWIIRYFTHFS